MKKKFTLPSSDYKDWEEYTNSPKDVYDKEKENLPERGRASRYIFDLHGYNLTEANEKVSEIINFCSEKNYGEILLITGKGLHSDENDVFKSKELSKLKFSIPDYIKSSKELADKILDIKMASKQQGGEGALVIKLKLQNKF